jgi:hypothetical protein
MTPTFNTEFNLVTKKLIVTDTFNYTDSVIDTAFGNATIKIGNQILHTNTNFNSSADIVFGVNTSFEIDLPLNADGTVRETDYEVTYDVRFTSNTSADVAADTFTVVTIPSNAALATLINDSIAAGVGMKATFNVGSTGGYTILSATSTTLTFASISITGAGTGLTSAIIASTSNSEAIENYSFCDITPISDLCVTSDCFYATLTAQDTTPYLASQTIVDRTLTINWPRLANGNPVESPVVTSDASQTIGPNLYTGGYLITLSTAITWTQTDGLIITNTVAARSDYTVNCEGSICSAFNCIKAYAVKYQQAVAVGGRLLDQFTQQNFQILLYCNLYNIAVECQNTTEARAILVALGEYMSISGVTVAGCDCGCGQSSANSTEPTVIYPLYNSAVYNSATELAKGIAELANQSESENAASEATVTDIDHTKILTPRGWRWAWDKALTLAWSFAEKISFLKGINIVSSTTPSVDGDVTFNSTRYYGKASGNVVSFITSNITAEENSVGAISLASQTEAENAGDLSVNVSALNDTKAMTPKKWRQAWSKALFNAANVSSGASPRFINATSGVATFTDTLASGAASTFVLQNSLVTTSSIIQYCVKYANSNQAIVVVSSYSIPSDGLIYFNVNNVGNQASNANISISFTILNP